MRKVRGNGKIASISLGVFMASGVIGTRRSDDLGIWSIRRSRDGRGGGLLTSSCALHHTGDHGHIHDSHALRFAKAQIRQAAKADKSGQIRKETVLNGR